ncbi:glycosyltransferase family 8 protein [Lactobacillus sp. ESL0791]|uniref:glycosyltransferase family 8 protein n=1 Tax=Lactobacillus sp. ESL0791 TaxID=2983234 RepID=UPI0023F79225|nr:glycosyltransferase family 8 protein [Lactobacillus sp. ESL0791]MDF7639029.1 glycosyltransferase family 8 protein [Lactobacillus sp. ESL0791]
MQNNENELIEILVTIDQNYIKPLEVMLYSIKLNNMYGKFRIWVIYENISSEALFRLKRFAKKLNFQLNALAMNNDFAFPESLLNLHDYPEEMYFRLLSGNILPRFLHKVIYLDPDILVINSLLPLWQLDLQNAMFAAAAHKGLTDIVSSINNLRLGTDTSYFNSGIMVLNLDKMRQKIKVQDIVDAINENHDTLILPDQDILNYLYSKYILQIPEIKWNYDSRSYSVYLAKSSGKHNLEWVMKNTAIIHFCGKPKPWQTKSSNRFKVLYLNYQQLTNKLLQK